MSLERSKFILRGDRLPEEDEEPLLRQSTFYEKDEVAQSVPVARVEKKLTPLKKAQKRITELESEDAKLKQEHANLEPYWQQATKWETQAKDLHVVEKQLEKAERDKWSYKDQLGELRRKVASNSTYQATGYEDAAGPLAHLREEAEKWKSRAEQYRRQRNELRGKTAPSQPQDTGLPRWKMK